MLNSLGICVDECSDGGVHQPMPDWLPGIVSTRIHARPTREMLAGSSSDKFTSECLRHYCV